MAEIKLNAKERMKRLYDSGVTRKEIQQATKQIYCQEKAKKYSRKDADTSSSRAARALEVLALEMN
jgi:hypothetical protein